jgi:hypothetical protein
MIDRMQYQCQAAPVTLCDTATERLFLRERRQTQRDTKQRLRSSFNSCVRMREITKTKLSTKKKNNANKTNSTPNRLDAARYFHIEHIAKSCVCVFLFCCLFCFCFLFLKKNETMN